MDRRFEYLDSFRGILAISVILFHSGYSPFTMHGFYLGVIGFFILSSFLLTYRLLKQYSKSSTVKEILRCTINYIITRTFRIYLPYCIFLKINTYFLGFNHNTIGYSTIDLLSLRHWARNKSILWTMPVEIRFYFLIPFISFLFSRIYTHKIICWLLHIFNLSFLILIRKRKLFSIGTDEEISRFELYIPVFMIGSTLALIYANLETTKWIEILDKYKIYNYLLTIPCVIFFIYLCRYEAWYENQIVRDDAYLYSAGISGLLFFMLIAPSNFFNQFMSKSIILNLFGKFSFGTYLFHMNVILYMINKQFNKRFPISTDYAVVMLTLLHLKDFFAKSTL